LRDKSYEKEAVRDMEQLKSIQWENEKFILLDQTLLPNDIVYEEFDTSVWQHQDKTDCR
jgi:hypothetical protein